MEVFESLTLELQVGHQARSLSVHEKRQAAGADTLDKQQAQQQQQQQGHMLHKLQARISCKSCRCGQNARAAGADELHYKQASGHKHCKSSELLGTDILEAAGRREHTL